MRFTRFVRHMLVPSWRVDRAFTPEVMAAIELAVQDSEARHRGEIRFAVEGGLDFPALLQGVDARSRAVDVFAHLRVWDTEENTGVLIYVQWLDRRVEIVADLGFEFFPGFHGILELVEPAHVFLGRGQRVHFAVMPRGRRIAPVV